MALRRVPADGAGAVGDFGRSAGERPATGAASDGLARAFRSTTATTPWVLVGRIPLSFETFHPQGLTRVGDRLFLSSADVAEPAGHLFVLDLEGRLLRDLRVGEGELCHPGGIDTDGAAVWLPVAEYRPASRSIICRVDATSLEAETAFGVDDHVGALAVGPDDGVVHGLTWGSRHLLTWTLEGAELSRRLVVGRRAEYQDGQFVAPAGMVCGGLAKGTSDDGEHGDDERGALALIDLTDGRVGHEVPFPHRSPAGHAVTRNPVLVELVDGGLRLWAAPDNGDEAAGTELLIYDAFLP